MASENIEIKTSKEKFFLEYLILKKPIIDSILKRLNSNNKATLSDLPMSVLAQLLYYNDKYRDMPQQERYNLIFSKKTKELICDALDMKEHHLNIYLSQLRKLKILNGKSIRNIFVVYSGDIHSINFTFKLNGHTQ